MRLYLAGPMRGIPEFNFPAFGDATRDLRALGHEVFSPAEKDWDDGFRPMGMKGTENVEIGPMLAHDLEYICRFAEAVVVLPGWDTSLGVKAEVATAEALGKPVWPLENVLAADEEPWAGTAANPYTIPLSANVNDLKPTGRTFEGGAYRDTENGKLDYEGFLSPQVLEEFAHYMHKHRVQSDGNLRDSDNWQKGMPLDVYMKSMWRHFMDVWRAHRGRGSKEMQLDALMALLFNVQGYAFELLRSNVGLGQSDW